MNPSLQIHSLFSNNSESLILGRLGANYSLRFLGPPRGVLPIGPKGIHGLGTLPPLISTLQPSPLLDADTNAAILSYNYTIQHQGLATDISCSYDRLSPITFLAAPNNMVIPQASCEAIGLIECLSRDNLTATTDTDQTLTFWACKSIPLSDQGPAYYIYLRGRGKTYEKNIGNITCIIFPAQPAIFPVTYQSSTRVFSTQERITTSPPAIAFSLHRASHIHIRY
jgi:hypothetical protein